MHCQSKIEIGSASGESRATGDGRDEMAALIDPSQISDESVYDSEYDCYWSLRRRP
jgi:hypothetical protein